MVGVGSVVRGRGGAGSAAGAGEVDGAVGGVLVPGLHLRPAPRLHAVSALAVRISLRDAVRLVLKKINTLNSCILIKDYFVANFESTCPNNC